MIELDRVSKIFGSGGGGELAAVAELSLTIPAGSATLITGPSGSGKTTLLGLIGGLVRPTAGRIRVAGREISRLPEEALAELRRRRLGFVFQSHHLIRGASALANVMLPALPAAEFDGNLPRHARALLARFGLAARAAERVEHLSGGEQQRVAIARALIFDPPVILADEPTAHLDAITAGAFLRLLAELRNEGRTLVVASHDPVLCGSRDFFSQRFDLRAGRLRERRRPSLPGSSPTFPPDSRGADFEQIQLRAGEESPLNPPSAKGGKPGPWYCRQVRPWTASPREESELRPC